MKKFKDNTFYSFDDNFGDRAIGWRIDGVWRFIFDDFTEDDTGDFILDGRLPDIDVLIGGRVGHTEADLWARNPRKVK